MTKEENAQLNYLLGKLRYEAVNTANSQYISKQSRDMYMNLERKAYYIQKFMFIDGKENK